MDAGITAWWCAFFAGVIGLVYYALENCGLYSELREKEERVAVLEHDLEMAKTAMMQLAARKHEIELWLWALESDAGVRMRKRGKRRLLSSQSWHSGYIKRSISPEQHRATSLE